MHELLAGRKWRFLQLLVAVPSPSAVCLVVRNTLSRPRDRAAAGAGSPGVGATRGVFSGELADENAPGWSRLIGLS